MLVGKDFEHWFWCRHSKVDACKNNSFYYTACDLYYIDAVLFCFIVIFPAKVSESDNTALQLKWHYI